MIRRRLKRVARGDRAVPAETFNALCDMVEPLMNMQLSGGSVNYAPDGVRIVPNDRRGGAAAQVAGTLITRARVSGITGDVMNFLGRRIDHVGNAIDATDITLWALRAGYIDRPITEFAPPYRAGDIVLVAPVTVWNPATRADEARWHILGGFTNTCGA